MASPVQHSVVPKEHMHDPYRWIVADDAERLALSVLSIDVGKWLKQTGDSTVWELISEGPAVWRKRGANADLGTAAAANTSLTAAAGSVPLSGVGGTIDNKWLSLQLRVPVFDSVAEMVADTDLVIGQKVRWLGYITPGDGGGNDGEIVAPGTGTADGGSFIDLIGISGQVKGLFVDGVIMFRQFGASGDGIADDAVELSSALAFANGKPVFGTYGDIYKSTTAQVCKSELNLNGSKLLFSVTGAAECLDMRDNSTVINGTIECSGTSPSGSGQFQTPVVVGKYGPGKGYSNINIHNLVIISNRPNGNGIFITGNSNKVKISNIDFPNSSTLGRPILAHWGGADDPTAGTFHPNNIEISNITMGTMTDSSVDGGGVFVSGAYNVTVDNVVAESISWSGGIISTFAGDYGSYYAPAPEVDLMMTGLVFENCTAKTVVDRLVKVDNRSILDPGLAILPGPVLRNIVGKSSAGGDVGIVVSNIVGGYAENCQVDGFLGGFVTGQGVTGFDVIGGRYINSQEHNVSISNGTIPPVGCKVIRVITDSASLAVGNHAGIFLGSSDSCSAIDCVSGSSGDSTTAWGIRVDSAATNAVVIRNRVEAATSAAYSLGAGGDLTILNVFKDNISASGIAFQSGAAFVPVGRSGQGTLEFTEWVGGGTPEGTVIADIGSITHRNGSANALYVKQSGNGTNTGWVAK